MKQILLYEYLSLSSFGKSLFTEDEEEVEERKLERARRRALQSSLIQDLRAQYSEAPEEFRVSF